MIVSTCNRVEFYTASADSQAAFCALMRFAERQSGGIVPGVPDPFYALEGEEAIRHLFRVVSGLESMVVGETEIMGQVKKANADAAAAGMGGAGL